MCERKNCIFVRGWGFSNVLVGSTPMPCAFGTTTLYQRTEFEKFEKSKLEDMAYEPGRTDELRRGGCRVDQGNLVHDCRGGRVLVVVENSERFSVTF
jgi:hypothetical protein